VPKGKKAGGTSHRTHLERTVMTDKTAPTTEEHHEQLGTLEHLDPHLLVLDENVRDVARLDPDFAASVREHGVLQPITAVQGTDGVVRVRDGQLRTLAAIAADLDAIPVYVRPAADDTKTDAANRIVHQIVANDQRSALTDAQRAKGINQMLLAGVSPTRVAKRLSVRREVVNAAATAAGSEVAMSALEAGQLSLVEASALVEFAEDPRATDILLQAAGTAQFHHKVAQLQQERLAEDAKAKTAAQYAAQGYTILEDRPEWRDTSRVWLRHLRTADGGTPSADVVTDPAQWAVLLTEESGYVDHDGNEVDADSIDWETEDDPQAQAEEGMRHASTVVETSIWEPEWYLLVDPTPLGLSLPSFMLNREPNNRDGASLTGGDDAEARAEKERAERRRVLALNKLGQAAQGVRRQFVKEMLARKTPAKGWALFTATCLAQSPNLIAEYHARDIVSEFLGLGGTALTETIVNLGDAGDGRAQVVMLGMVLAALEGRLCGVSRYVHCSLVLLGLGGQRQRWEIYVYLRANG
jgi:ParB family chromosome partitioning protein